MKTVPTVWDETKFIQGEIGNFITVARRSGDTWYVGSMTDWKPREFDLEFDFLGDGNYSATILKDPNIVEGHPVKVSKIEKSITKNSI